MQLRTFTLFGWKKKQHRRWRCHICEHIWHVTNRIGMMSRQASEWLTYTYLRTLSFQQTRSIVESLHRQEVITKKTLITCCEEVADSMPSLWNVTAWLQPKRSGYYALDGTWLKYRGKDIVLLILFDIETLDVVSYCIAEQEDNESYRQLIEPVRKEIGTPRCFFCDGDSGLLKMLRDDYAGVPIQLCVFHKYIRIGQLIPFKYKRKDSINWQVKLRVEKVLFSETRVEAEMALVQLKCFAMENHAVKKVKQALAVIGQNYELLMTHFEYSDINDRYNNALEGFNSVVKRKTRLMKGFKKMDNIDRWVKLILLDWRFHSLCHSSKKERKNKSPLKLSECDLPKKIYNWITFVRQNYHATPTRKVACLKS